MKAVFLSDTHLKNAADPAYVSVLGFLKSLDGLDHLFILGDFFDFWFCDTGHVYPHFQPIINELKRLASAGVRVHLFEGNHDFFLDDYFAGTGIEVFPEWADLRLDGRLLLLSHGDLVDTEDRGYLFLRKVLRSQAFYRFQKFIPPKLRWILAAACSNASKEIPEKRTALARKMEEFSRARLESGYDAVILGHCHLPSLKEFAAGGKAKVFCTLGDWLTHFSYLEYESGSFRLCFWK